ncbi:MAG: GlcG/HbpS family heme-binding protein [Candidatus Dormibacteraceae bacterium]
MSIDLEQARLAAAAAQRRAAEMGVRVAVAVVDSGGHLVFLSRMDGSPALAPEIAEGKAVGAAVLQRAGDALAEMHEKRPGFFAAITGLARRPIVPGLGSVLVGTGDRVLGAIGVSGARPEQDLECAQAGLAAVPRL